jgi:hypothetical protein
MELYATTALSGLGYMASGSGSSSFRSESVGAPIANDVPTMKSVYESDGVRAARHDEQLRGQAMWDASQNPMESGIVPRPAYASMFQAPQAAQAAGQIQSLTGEMMRPEEFTHKNMQPFFGGFQRQNTDAFANSSILESYTGSGGDLQHKKEVGCFFEPTKGMTNICGMDANANDFYVNRIAPSFNRNNEFPIDQVRVGPGINNGYTNVATGGFQQADTREFVMPPTVDELRVLTNPKMEYEAGPLGPAGNRVSARGLVAPMDKNRPETYSEQSPDQWLRTTGAFTAETGRPDNIIKPTARVEYSASEYMGGAKSTDRVGKGDTDDYGKTNILVYGNERDVTQTRTVVNNVTSIIKAIIAPFTDILRHNKAEYTLEHPRTFGSMGAQIPEKATLYDPVNYVMRTTIKETTIHDGVIGNLANSVPGGYAKDVDPDLARKTGRETLDLMDTVRNVGYHKYKTVVYNPDEVAKRTIRETTSRNSREEGNIGGATERRTGAYTHVPITVYATQKQFISDHDYMGVSGSTGDFRPMSEESANNMIIDATREAIEITERMPTPSGAKVAVSKSGVDLKSKRHVSESIAPRLTGGMPNKTNKQFVLSPNSCDITKPAARLTGADTRLDPGLLSAFHSNPYTKSLTSVA